MKFKLFGNFTAKNTTTDCHYVIQQLDINTCLRSCIHVCNSLQFNGENEC